MWSAKFKDLKIYIFNSFNYGNVFFLALTNDEEVVEQNGDYTFFFHDTKEKTTSDSFSSSGSQSKLLSKNPDELYEN